MRCLAAVQAGLTAISGSTLNGMVEMTAPPVYSRPFAVDHLPDSHAIEVTQRAGIWPRRIEDRSGTRDAPCRPGRTVPAAHPHRLMTTAISSRTCSPVISQLDLYRFFHQVLRDVNSSRIATCTAVPAQSHVLDATGCRVPAFSQRPASAHGILMRDACPATLMPSPQPVVGSHRRTHPRGTPRQTNSGFL